LTSRVNTLLAQKRMRRSSARKATSSNDSNSDSNVNDDLSFESLSSKVVELENVLCNQDKLLCKVFHENKKLNLKLKNSFAEIASL
jgi:BRCT domain type II-containing protein